MEEEDRGQEPGRVGGGKGSGAGQEAREIGSGGGIAQRCLIFR